YEAGMRLRGATRAADAAIWRRADLGAYHGGLRRVPPILAVEVAGDDDAEGSLRDKARWYRDAGVVLVWVGLAETPEGLVCGAAEERYRLGQTLPPHPALPDLRPRVDDLFLQISTV